MEHRAEGIEYKAKSSLHFLPFKGRVGEEMGWIVIGPISKKIRNKILSR
jgi:hypothetical protein